MSKKIDQEELKVILNAVAFFSQGATLEEITHALKHSIPKRTLQRRISLLVNQKQLKAIGNSRARKYVVQYEPSIKRKLLEENFLPLSPEAKILQDDIEQPIQTRKYVGYKREFLDSYRPNNTYYLSETMRKQLWEMGKSLDGERAAGTYARQILNRLLIDLSWNSSRLEGNTYSILETESLIELGQFSEGKDIKEAQMILYPINLGELVFGFEKAPRLNDRKWPHITNIEPLTIVQSRGFLFAKNQFTQVNWV